MRDLCHKPKDAFFSGVADAMDGGLCIQDTIASRYIYDSLNHYLHVCIYLTLFGAGFLCAFRDPISSQI